MKIKKPLITHSIGLTGGIGSGKSACGSFFSDLGIPVLEQDILSRKVVAPNSCGNKELKKVIGTKYFTLGRLNRKNLRDAIFVDSNLRRSVEQVIHPLVKKEAEKWLKKQKECCYQIIISPLLFESQQHLNLDASIVVWVTPEKQISRTIKRDNCSRDHAEAIMRLQMPTREKLTLSTFNINNDGSMEDLKVKVLKIHRKLLKRYG